MSKIEWTDETCRVCWACRESKPIDAFGSDRTRSDGKNRICRDCKNKRARDRHVRVAVPRTRRGRRIRALTVFEKDQRWLSVGPRVAGGAS